MFGGDIYLDLAVNASSDRTDKSVFKVKVGLGWVLMADEGKAGSHSHLVGEEYLSWVLMADEGKEGSHPDLADEEGPEPWVGA